MLRPVIVLVAYLSLSSAAFAQTDATSFLDLQTRLKVGDEVIVTDDAGGIMTGRVSQLPGTSLGLRVSGRELQLLASDVRLIERPKDRLWNGMAIGGAVGFATGAVLAATDDCGGTTIGPCFRSAAGTLAVGGLLGLIGLGAGVAIDVALSRPRLVYARLRGAAARGSTVPFFSRGQIGVRIHVDW
jgi:hypothetical protein